MPLIESKHFQKTIRNILWICASLFFLGILGTVFLTSDLPDIRPPEEEVTSFTEGWYYMEGDEERAIASFPFSLSNGGEELILCHKIPPLTDIKYLSFKNQFQEIQAYAGELCIYEYKSSASTPAGKLLGNFRCFIPLQPEYEGQTISLHLKSTTSITVKGLQNIELGSSDAFVLDILSNNFTLAVCLIFMFLTALLLYLVYLVQDIKKLSYDYKSFLYIGSFLLLSALWMWSDSELPQLICSNATMVCLISFFSFMALPIPLLSFVRSACHQGKSLLIGMQCVLIVNIIVQFLLYSIESFDFPSMLPVTHLLILLYIGIIIVLLFREVRLHASFEAKGILAATLLLILCSIAALVQFYLRPNTDNSRFFRYGLIMFIGILLFLSGKNLIRFLEERTQTKLYQQLAYTDIMTQTPNRIAFDECIDRLRQSGISGGSLTVVMLDLNNLKETNDTYGHRAGDELLKGAARSIKNAFQNVGTTYRIGGDEFVVLIEKGNISPGHLFRIMDQDIAQFNTKSIYSLSIARGYASNDGDSRKDIDSILSAADQNMYKNKAATKGICR
ncbi:GGDEF domain-containing protein [Lactonifactor longoviformis]|uniref:GGDEF domain-containing protein n=1 Tax=Lactonifactor longoviformis TaxID=341220 RepID=UPI0036F37884